MSYYSAGGVCLRQIAATPDPPPRLRVNFLLTFSRCGKVLRRTMGRANYVNDLLTSWAKRMGQQCCPIQVNALLTLALCGLFLGLNRRNRLVTREAHFHKGTDSVLARINRRS